MGAKIILISGNRNLGKLDLACRIGQTFSRVHVVTRCPTDYPDFASISNSLHCPRIIASIYANAVLPDLIILDQYPWANSSAFLPLLYEHKDLTLLFVTKSYLTSGHPTRAADFILTSKGPLKGWGQLFAKIPKHEWISLVRVTREQKEGTKSVQYNIPQKVLGGLIPSVLIELFYTFLTWQPAIVEILDVLSHPLPLTEKFPFTQSLFL